MISVSLGDLVKLLDQIPMWKAMSGLPKRIAALEERISALEAGAKSRSASVPAALRCPVCEGRMKVVRESDDPVFGRLGVKQHAVECPHCGTTATRQFDPGKGYG